MGDIIYISDYLAKKPKIETLVQKICSVADAENYFPEPQAGKVSYYIFRALSDGGLSTSELVSKIEQMGCHKTHLYMAVVQACHKHRESGKLKSIKNKWYLSLYFI